MKHYIRTCSYLDQDEVVVWIRVRRQRYSVQPVTTCRSAALASLATSSYSLYFNIDSFVFVPAQFILHNSVYPSESGSRSGLYYALSSKPTMIT